MTLALESVSIGLGKLRLEVNEVISTPVTAIYGASGAGKTTLLDLIAGLRKLESGRIEHNGRRLADAAAGIHVPARERRIGYVPQDLALFPHLSVRRNIEYGYAAGSGEKGFDFGAVIAILELEPLLKRDTSDLSGGEKQRVALARALLRRPELLLLDEPLASLDFELKQRILPYFRRIFEEYHLPTLFVSHDRDEIIQLCDYGLKVENGKVVERGAPRELFNGREHGEGGKNRAG